MHDAPFFLFITIQICSLSLSCDLLKISLIYVFPASKNSSCKLIKQSNQPDIMDVTVKELFDFPAGVDVVHIGIQNDLEHHPGMVRAAPAFLIQLPETFKVQALNQSVNHPNWIMLCNILVNSWRKKHGLVGIVRTKMYLCHSIKCYA